MLLQARQGAGRRALMPTAALMPMARLTAPRMLPMGTDCSAMLGCWSAAIPYGRSLFNQCHASLYECCHTRYENVARHGLKCS